MNRYETRIQEMVEKIFKKSPDKELSLENVKVLIYKKMRGKWKAWTCYQYASRACLALKKKFTIIEVEKWGISNIYKLNIFKCESCGVDYVPKSKSESLNCMECGPGTQLWKLRVAEIKNLLISSEKNNWKLGDIAAKIPSQRGKRRDMTLYNKMTNLQLFAQEVCTKMGKPLEHWEDVYNRIRQYQQVSSRFNLDTRVTKLSWTHHRTVVAVDDAKKWLKKAEKDNWSCKKLRQELMKAGKIEVPWMYNYNRWYNRTDKYLDEIENLIGKLDDENRKKLEDLAKRILKMVKV